uniref:B box-type domain-containing protein n=1 Tax=Arcella intermedia TaxID=1963864 RepID=A0A6B2LCZ4_9EUKA
MQEHFPAISECLRSHNVLPECFCFHWLAGLCVTVLPFSALFNFFEYFFKQGHLYLFKFGLTLVSTFKEQILKSQPLEIYSILRLDKNLTDKHITTNTIIDIVERAATFELVPFDITSVRKEVHEAHLRPHLEWARQWVGAEGADTEEEGEEEGEECAACQENAPDMWCVPCNLLLCEKCHQAAKGEHQKHHKVDEDWLKYV